MVPVTLNDLMWLNRSEYMSSTTFYTPDFEEGVQPMMLSDKPVGLVWAEFEKDGSPHEHLIRLNARLIVRLWLR